MVLRPTPPHSYETDSRPSGRELLPFRPKPPDRALGAINALQNNTHKKINDAGRGTGATDRSSPNGPDRDGRPSVPRAYLDAWNDTGLKPPIIRMSCQTRTRVQHILRIIRTGPVIRTETIRIISQERQQLTTIVLPGLYGTSVIRHMIISRRRQTWRALSTAHLGHGEFGTIGGTTNALLGSARVT